MLTDELDPQCTVWVPGRRFAVIARALWGEEVASRRPDNNCEPATRHLPCGTTPGPHDSMRLAMTTISGRTAAAEDATTSRS